LGKGLAMSGILLPGQDEEPKREGKIEVPSGYGSGSRQPAQTQEGSNKETEETTRESTPPPEQTSASGEPGPGAAEVSGQAAKAPEFLFPPQAAQVQCPNCGSTYVVPVFSILDLGANPELRTPLLSGQINVGVCRTCGAGGQLNVPILVHDPEHEFLGVYAPMSGAGDAVQHQKAIGDLTRRLMAKIPSSSQRGYMLQPKEFVELDRLMEKLWEFEGVTPEMLRRQREQSSLLQKLIGLADDDSALDIAIERGKNLIDREFFTMLDQILMLARSQTESEELDSLRLLRDKLLERTDAGRKVKQQSEKIQKMLDRVSDQTTRQEVLDIVSEAWQDEEDAERMVGTFAMVTRIASDYEFLMLLAQAIDREEDDEKRESLEALRRFLVDLQDQLAEEDRHAQEHAAQDAQTLLQEVLQETDTEAALRERSEMLDEAFLALLADNIRRMEEAGSAGAARRLRSVYEQALAILQEQMPEDMKFLNQLITAPNDGAIRDLLREHHEMVTPDFVATLKVFEQQTRQSEHVELADKIKSIRAQASLML
jgi:hypothetical protein